MLKRCFAKGCAMRVEPSRFGCRGHWSRLPREFRDEVWEAHRAKDRARTLSLLRKAFTMSLSWETKR